MFPDFNEWFLPWEQGRKGIPRGRVLPGADVKRKLAIGGGIQ